MRDAEGVDALPEDVARWIAIVANSPLSTASSTLFQRLTAVAPNARRDAGGSPTAFWYQLPPLAPRHRPTLFVPRVSGGRPAAYANSIGAVVDANFATLWPVNDDALPADAVLALLNSSWTAASLEASCTVLGGGALKVEATDLRRLALPDLTPDDVTQLVGLGRRLKKGPIASVVFDIDHAIEVALNSANGPGRISEVRDLADELLRHRSRRN